jgi:hypothetical protein
LSARAALESSLDHRWRRGNGRIRRPLASKRQLSVGAVQPEHVKDEKLIVAVIPQDIRAVVSVGVKFLEDFLFASVSIGTDREMLDVENCDFAYIPRKPFHHRSVADADFVKRVTKWI